MGPVANIDSTSIEPFNEVAQRTPYSSDGESESESGDNYKMRGS